MIVETPAVFRLEGKQRTEHFQSKRKVLGQFFTPDAVARFMVNISRPFHGIAVDPSVGDGTFIKALMVEGYPIVYGVDVDPDVLRQCQAFTGRNLQFIEADALSPLAPKLSEVEGKAHLVIGNPPFSSKFGRINSPALLKEYVLGCQPGKRRARSSQALEVIFLERFIQLAGRGGQISIILPDGVLANPGLQYVRDFLMRDTFIKAVISLPRSIFSHTTSKTHILHLIKKRDIHEKQSFPVVLALADDPEDLPIIQKGIEIREPCNIPFITLKPVKEVIKNLTPEFYHPKHIAFEEELAALPWKRETLGKLLDELKTGGTAYGARHMFAEGGLRYISARTITVLGVDFSREDKYIVQGSPMDVQRGRVKEGDVLMVRVGVGCAGRVTLISGYGDEGVANDYIHIMRSSKINPAYLALFLQSKLGQLQLARRKHGVGTVSLSHGDLKAIEVLMPGNDIEDAFGLRYMKIVKTFRSNLLNGKECTQLLSRYKQLLGEFEQFLLTSVSGRVKVLKEGW